MRRSTLASPTPFSSRWPRGSNLLAQQWDSSGGGCNDALAAVATAYFDVQASSARGPSASATSTRRPRPTILVRHIEGLARLLWPRRSKWTASRTLLLDLEQEIVALCAAPWRSSSSRLNRVLRRTPSAVVVPLEPPQLQVTLIPPGGAVDDDFRRLDEPAQLASHKALVQATLELLRQERLRPLLPSLVFQGGNGPGGVFNGGVFEGGPNDEPYVGGGRFDAEVGVVWTLNNLGGGNRARCASAPPSSRRDARTLRHRGPGGPGNR